MATPNPKIRATVLLCDAAQEMGGKLYILGGGWSRATALGPIVNMALAVKLRIPWHEANRRLVIRFDLVTEDGKPVAIGPGNLPFFVEGQLEVGRPPGLRPGTDLDSAFAVPIGIELKPGTYRWDVSIGGEKVEDVAFEVLAPPPGFIVPRP